HHEIRLIAPTEAATHQSGVNNHGFRREFGNAGDDALCPLRRLRGYPRFRAVGPDVHGAVHRLHGGVSREGKFVKGFDPFRGAVEGGVRIALLATTLPGLAAWSRNCWRSEAEDSDAAGPSSQVI